MQISQTIYAIVVGEIFIAVQSNYVSEWMISKLLIFSWKH